MKVYQVFLFVLLACNTLVLPFENYPNRMNGHRYSRYDIPPIAHVSGYETEDSFIDELHRYILGMDIIIPAGLSDDEADDYDIQERLKALRSIKQDLQQAQAYDVWLGDRWETYAVPLDWIDAALQVVDDEMIELLYLAEQ